MKIALIGASGFVGSELLEEALARGHEVTAIVRHPEKLASRARLIVKTGDIQQGTELNKLVSGNDVVISSVRFLDSDAKTLIDAVKESKVKRLLVVGGAATLEVAPGVQLIDAPTFPAEYKAEALAGKKFLAALKEEKDLDWTFLSPSAIFFRGERTGKFRLGKDQLLVNPQGESKISTSDFAIAMLDEAENPRHSRQRFTAGY